ncbi:hypothetical protein [Streptomyces rapamycinicus]|uniref:hypothetical protein n=1 Tax=Streptomyces rapamycinicus TaxID=1226757 RepID=UPI003140C4F7
MQLAATARVHTHLVVLAERLATERREHGCRAAEGAVRVQPQRRTRPGRAWPPLPGLARRRPRRRSKCCGPGHPRRDRRSHLRPVRHPPGYLNPFPVRITCLPT